MKSSNLMLWAVGAPAALVLRAIIWLLSIIFVAVASAHSFSTDYIGGLAVPFIGWILLVLTDLPFLRALKANSQSSFSTWCMCALGEAVCFGVFIVLA